MLTPKKRLTKKELKEDKLVTYYFKTQQWLEKNSKIVYGTLAVVAVLVVASILYSNHLKGAESQATVELAKATRVYESGDYTNAITLLSTVVDKYGSTTSGKIGTFYLANSFYQIGDYTNAMTYFKKSAAKLTVDDHLAASANAGVAACLEQTEQFAEAAKKYETTATKYSKAPLAPQYLFKAARCYTLAENTDKAATLYDKIISDYADDVQVKEDAELFKAML